MNITLILALTLLVPLLTTFIVLFLHKHPNTRDTTNTTLAVVSFVLSLILLVQYINNNYLQATITIIKFSNINIYFTLSKINIAFALMVNFLWIISIIYTVGYLRAYKSNKQSIFFSFFSLSIFATNCIAFSGNLVTSFIFYEILTLATLPLVGFYYTQATKANVKTYLYTLTVTSVTLFLAGVVTILVWANHTNYNVNGILYGIGLSQLAVFVSFLLFMFGVAKAGIMPVHIWLPNAMVAPTPVSALLHAVAVVKSGVFIMLKVINEIYGINYLYNMLTQSWLYYIVITIPLATIIIGSSVAIFQNSIKKMLAYSTVSQLSYIVVAGLILTPAGVSAAYLHILAHAFSKIALFFAAGAFISLAHIYNIDQLKGIAKQMPITAFAFTLGALSLVGTPFTIGFSSKYAIINAALLASNYYVVVVIIISTILQLLYFMPVIYTMYFNTHTSKQNQHTIIKSKSINIALLVVSACIILLFFASPYVLMYLNQ